MTTSRLIVYVVCAFFTLVRTKQVPQGRFAKPRIIGERDAVAVLIALALLIGTALALATPGQASAAEPLPDCSGDAQRSNPATECIGTTPIVPSLDPEWSESFDPPPMPRLRAFAQVPCRPLNAAFYAETDWLRLAQKLRADPSPCADYFVSIPPLAADKTQLRNGEAAKIRALGPQMHAAAEINVTGWSNWVAAGNGTWFDAGVEARRRIAAAGFDVAAGDIWAVNELSSAVRQGTGTARTDVRDLIRGLYTGDGNGPTVQGLVWVVGIGQATADLTTYKSTLKSWYQDTGFWADMSQYVRFWSQEVFGDVRKWAVPGADLATRRDTLIEYVEHASVLAEVSPPLIAGVKGFMEATDMPLANAAWVYTSAFGFTSLPSPQMQAYVASQVYALRNYQAREASRSGDSFGFAWSPQNGSLGLTSSQFTSQSGAILDRLVASIHASDASNDDDPGVDACGPDTTWCTANIDGSSFNLAWQILGTWTQPLATDSKATMTEDVPAEIPLVASDADGDQLVYTIVDPPKHGSLTGSGASRTYTPEHDFNGTDAFTFMVFDGAMNSRVATVRITVTAANDAPTVELSQPGPVDEGTPLTLTAHATDVDGDAVTYTWATRAGTLAPAGDTATLTVDDGPGTAQVTVTANDGQGGTGSVTVAVDVRNVAPTADAGGGAETPWGTPVSLSGSATDPSTADTTAGLEASWDFGDGSPGATGLAANHTYAEPGKYRATLSVRDKDGGIGVDTAEVTVLRRPASIHYAGPSNLDESSSSAVLAVRLDDVSGAQGAQLAGHAVTIALGPQTCTATTDDTGLARCAVDASVLPLGAATVKATYAGDELYTPASVAAAISLFAPLTVDAVDRTRQFGSPNPSLTYQLKGFVHGDTPAVVSGSATCSTTAAATSTGGSYPITCTAGTLSAENYVFEFARGTLIVAYTTTVAGRVEGPIRIGSGQSLDLAAGADVRGPVTVAPGGSLDVEGASIHGSLRAQGSAAIRICDATVSGPFDAIGDSGPLLAGNGTPACPSSRFSGPLTVRRGTSDVEIVAAVVHGPLTVTGNNGQTSVTGNSVTGPLTVTGNIGTVVDAPNTVSGPSTLQ